MPILSVKHESRGSQVRAFLITLLQNAFDDFGFDLLAFTVEGIELPGQLSRANRIVGKKQLDDITCACHSARRVDTRCQPEGNLICGGAFSFLKTGYL